MISGVNVSALKIHMSENAREALDAFPEFITEPRGEITVKVVFSYFRILGVHLEFRLNIPIIRYKVARWCNV